MPEIRPFRGLIYNARIVGDLSLMTAPPYDVVSLEEREKYYRRSRYNIVRLILGKDLPGDSRRENKYTRAKAFLEDWQRRGVLHRDEKPALYVYEHEYGDQDGRPVKRLGFIALVKLEAFGGDILPHERTHESPRADRLNLIRATQANLCPVFTLYRDTKNQSLPVLAESTAETPTLSVLDEANVTHRIWRLTDDAKITKIAKAIKKSRLYIADGHHRYETALAYRDEMKDKGMNGDGPFEYVMMFLTDMENQELRILPTHRVLKNLPKLNRQRLKENMGQFFDVASFSSLGELMSRIRKSDQKVIGAYLGEDQYCLLTVRDKSTLADLPAPQLDVTVLHNTIIRTVLGLGGTNIENSIKYTTDEQEAVGLVSSGRYDIAFFLKPAELSEILTVADAGDTMPQKSTYFFPKPLTGLVINKPES